MTRSGLVLRVPASIHDFRFVGGRYDQFSALAADLVRREVSVIAASGVAAAIAAKAATQSIPREDFLLGGKPAYMSEG
jgi:putative ABC transport system substrate-binding protein